MLRHLMACAMLFLVGCDWYMHQKEIDKELEDIGVEDAKLEVQREKKELNPGK